MIGDQNNMKIKYDKLVRNNIPDIIRNAKKTCITRHISGNEKIEYLFRKLIEEGNELATEKNINELADLQEVIDSIIAELGFTKEAVEKEQKRKREERGSFSEGIVLLEVNE